MADLLDVVVLEGTVVEAYEESITVEFVSDKGIGVTVDLPREVFASSLLVRREWRQDRGVAA